MGIDVQAARFLLFARKMGVDFASTAMLGRQRLLLDRQDLQRAFEAFGHGHWTANVESIFAGKGGFGEPLFEQLGATSIHSFDNSAYEGASHLHDMNTPIPAEMEGQYSVVIDGGSLEHIFNFPVALRNCMGMVRVGGHYVGITPANNFLGHGFYQFSPELFFSVFTPANGFEVIKVIACEVGPASAWYSVSSPMEIGRRVTLENRSPTYLLILARRISSTPIFATTPQQSDYIAAWSEDKGSSHRAGAPRAPAPSSPVDWLKQRIPASIKQPLKELFGVAKPEFDTRFFQPMDPEREPPPR